MNKYEIKILQINLNRSSGATESTLQYAIENKIDIILIQEPWIISEKIDDFTNSRSINHQGFIQLKSNTVLRPRTLAYIAKNPQFDINISNISPKDDTDLLILNLISGPHDCQLINVYNEKGQGDSILRTLNRILYPIFDSNELKSNLLLVGDFNLHHNWWNPRTEYNSPNSVEFVNWIENQDFNLINKPGKGTFFRPHMNQESILDLTFATPNLANKINNWLIIPNLGSDHFGLQYSINYSDSNLVNNPVQLTGFDTKLANWDLFNITLQSELKNSQYLNSSEFENIIINPIDILVNQIQEIEIFDSAALEFTNIITKAAEKSIPKKKLGPNPKPWWNENLKNLRKTMILNSRSLKANISNFTKQQYLIARNSYFQAIKKAKRNHWNLFLEKSDPKSIFKAFSYTNSQLVEKIPEIKSINSENMESTFQGKCNSFRKLLFPTPPKANLPNWDKYIPRQWKWPKLSKIELKNACLGKIKGKTPGPDLITQEIISRAYKTIPHVFYRLYSKLLNSGYHPTNWRQATGAILKKPNKPDYSIPKAYRIISLLNCLGKISERIFAQRLSYLAETTNLLHNSQIGGRKKKSAIDAALLLQNEVELNKELKLKTSILFVDIQGAFDHVAKNQLLTILQGLGLPLSLIAWVFTFLSKRLLRLAFDGKIEEFVEIVTGIPQGSPISPILFLIYIRNLFKSNSIRYLSYIDDIALIASSKSYSMNCKILEREIKQITEIGFQNAIKFDLAKTELIHFGSKTIKNSINLPDGNNIQPSNLVKWLGIWFDPNLTYKYHVATKASKAKSNLQRMTRIVNISRGLSPTATRQLYLASIVTIADYGSILWWKGQKGLIKPLQIIQNSASLKILGVFKTAPILAREVESALLPPEIRLNSNIRQYCFRLKKFSINHPINQEFENNRLIRQNLNQKLILQLDRIFNSIFEFVENIELEKLKSFYFAPWAANIPYSIEISKLNKELATKQHLDLINSTKYEKSIFNIYTDASNISNPESKGIGVGIAVFNQNRLIYQETINIGISQLVYNGELQGITQAIEYSDKIAKSGNKFRIFSDNQAGLNRLIIPSDNPGQDCQIKTINSTNSIIKKGAKIELYWSPGHSDIPGNELVDKLAKSATIKNPNSNITSFAVLGNNIKQLKKIEWENRLNSAIITNYSRQFNWKINSKITIPRTTKREFASAFYQLKFGHGYIKSYLYRLNHVGNNKCSCGVKETPEHLLLSCIELKEARKELKDQLEINILTLKILMHTKIGIEKTLRFIEKTKIATRGWHLERAAREEEGEEEWF
jgi:ribonuclease HI